MKIASTDFINVQPLVFGLERPGIEMAWETPDGCARALQEGRVDVALTPSIEYARIRDLKIIPGISISSKGPVKSVILFLRRGMTQIGSVALDERSRTAAALVRIILHEKYHRSPHYDAMPADLGRMLSKHDAALVIGDAAMRAAESFPGETLDLGQAWYEMTGLPFTYAFWALRPFSGAEEHVRTFYECRDAGLKSRLDIASRSKTAGLTESVIFTYLTRHICYDLGSEEHRGLELFYELAGRQDLTGFKPELDFYDDDIPCRQDIGRGPD